MILLCAWKHSRTCVPLTISVHFIDLIDQDLTETRSKRMILPVVRYDMMIACIPPFLSSSAALILLYVCCYCCAEFALQVALNRSVSLKIACFMPRLDVAGRQRCMMNSSAVLRAVRHEQCFPVLLCTAYVCFVLASYFALHTCALSLLVLSSWSDFLHAL